MAQPKAKKQKIRRVIYKRRRAELLHYFVPSAQVISNGMQKSVLVTIDRLVRHKKYDRVLRRTTKLMVREVVKRVLSKGVYLGVVIHDTGRRK